MANPVVAIFRRSPFTPATKGEFAHTRPDELLSQVIKGVIEEFPSISSEIEDVIVGCAFPEAEQGFNVGRMVSFLSGLPNSTGGVTINRFCGSSMQSIHNAAGAIALGSGEAFLCCGVESMSRIPMTGFNPLPHPRLMEEYPGVFTSMGVTAENLTKSHNITREEQEEFAVSSHIKAKHAQKSGSFDDEIIAINTENGIVEKDSCIRPETTVEILSKLRPVFDKSGTVTAGTSSPLTDGATVVLVCSEEFAQRHGIKPMARIIGTAVSGCEPEYMGLGPIEASKKALERAGLTLDDIDIIELNEAFSAQSLAVIKEMQLNIKKVNLEGGAIALGHPLGASGARITGKAAQLLVKEGKNLALATMCIGGGQGIATVLEKFNVEN